MNPMPVVENLSLPEKLALMERLWDDLSRRAEDMPVPEWHAVELARRLEDVKAGREQFIDWDVARRQLEERLR